MNEHDRLSFEYFVLRCIPRVDRGECINVGVVLYCRELEFLEAACSVSAAKLRALAPELDLTNMEEYLLTIDAICRGEAEGCPAAGLSQRQRFDWLSAPRSTAVQPGPVHTGLTADPSADLHRLLEKLVL